MEIKVTINAPELVSALNALAAAIQCAAPQPKQEVGITFSSSPESVTPVEVIPQETKPSISLVDLRGKISESLKTKNITSEQVRNLLDQYDVVKLTELNEQDYQSFHDRLFAQ